MGENIDKNEELVSGQDDNVKIFSEPGLPEENSLDSMDGIPQPKEQQEEKFDLTTREGIEKRYEKRMQDVKNLQGAIAREVGCSYEELNRKIKRKKVSLIEKFDGIQGKKYIQGVESDFHGRRLLDLMSGLDHKARSIEKEREDATRELFSNLERKI